jgi:dihydrofolate synthase / folylpolyglutamate synthase
LTGPTYPELLRDLFPRLTGGVRWGLERTLRILASAGDPHLRFPTIHVGGTNGKGSVAASLASVLRAAGQRTGCYTSPHLCSFRERIQIDGQPVTEQALLDAARRLWPAVQREQPTFFEATTVLAFLALADAGVEAAVVEVGLGGRLDATNVVRPEVVALTNVALDHAEYLGTTLEAIAGEKAGILKAGVPAVTAETRASVLDVFRTRAASVGAPLRVLAEDAVADVATGLGGTAFTLATERWGRLAIRTPLIGAHQASNAALAVAAAELLPPPLRPDRDAVLRGLAEVRWPGRLQVERLGDELWLLDVAHNAAGIEALAATLARLELPRPIVLLIGILGDKDWNAMLPPLLALADTAVLTVPATAPAERRWDPVAVAERFGGAGAVAVPDFREAFERARSLAADAAAGRGGQRRGCVVVTGSVHTVGDALALLDRTPFGVDPPLPAPSERV